MLIEIILVEVPIPTVVVTPTKSTNPTDCVAIPIEDVLNELS